MNMIPSGKIYFVYGINQTYFNDYDTIDINDKDYRY